MLDQSFSPDNFQKIIAIENRKGNYLVGEFFPHIAELDIVIKDARRRKKLLRTKRLAEAETNQPEDDSNGFGLDKLLENKDRLLFQELQKISQRLDSSDYRLGIELDSSISEKPVYKTPKNIDSILMLKQLQYNVRKIYKVKQSNRYSILNHLRVLLDDGFPKIILKTDIKDFYESIPQNELLRKINNENLLTQSSRKVIFQILKEYTNLASSPIGVPRGIGISAYLVELYMRDFDNKVKEMPHVIYYSRYVDDIIIMFTPSSSLAANSQRSKIKELLANDGLSMNETGNKTKLIDFKRPSNFCSYELDYLGYKFAFGIESTGKPTPLKITMSDKKLQKYRTRLDLTAKQYTNNISRNEKMARKILKKRLKFMTCNIRLINNKKNILAGLFYSNSLINDHKDLYELDTYLNAIISNLSIPVDVKNKMKQSYSFTTGFNPKNVVQFKTSDYKLIKKGWI